MEINNKNIIKKFLYHCVLISTLHKPQVQEIKSQLKLENVEINNKYMTKQTCRTQQTMFTLKLLELITYVCQKVSKNNTE